MLIPAYKPDTLPGCILGTSGSFQQRRRLSLIVYKLGPFSKPLEIYEVQVNLRLYITGSLFLSCSQCLHNQIWGEFVQPAAVSLLAGIWTTEYASTKKWNFYLSCSDSNLFLKSSLSSTYCRTQVFFCFQHRTVLLWSSRDEIKVLLARCSFIDK